MLDRRAKREKWAGKGTGRDVRTGICHTSLLSNRARFGPYSNAFDVPLNVGDQGITFDRVFAPVVGLGGEQKCLRINEHGASPPRPHGALTHQSDLIVASTHVPASKTSFAWASWANDRKQAEPVPDAILLRYRTRLRTDFPMISTEATILTPLLCYRAASTSGPVGSRTNSITRNSYLRGENHQHVGRG